MTSSFKSLCAGIALCGASAIAFAAGNPLSVHVLNLQDGLPSPGVKVLLEKQSGKDWTALHSGTTNEQGFTTCWLDYFASKARQQLKSLGTYERRWNTNGGVVLLWHSYIIPQYVPKGHPCSVAKTTLCFNGCTTLFANHVARRFIGHPGKIPKSSSKLQINLKFQNPN